MQLKFKKLSAPKLQAFQRELSILVTEIHSTIIKFIGASERLALPRAPQDTPAQRDESYDPTIRHRAWDEIPVLALDHPPRPEEPERSHRCRQAREDLRLRLPEAHCQALDA